MKPVAASLRSLALLIPLVAAAAGFAGGGKPTSCATTISAWLSCPTNGFNAYFSATAAGTINGDTIWLTGGSVYLAPTHGGPGMSARPRLRAGAGAGTGSAVVVKTTYATASGPSQDTLPLGRVRHGTTLAAASPAWFLVSDPSSSTTVVALVRGNLTSPALQPGCQLTYPGSDTVAVTSATQATLDSIASHFSITINVPNNGNC
ncbi:MAG: hypothetical protein JWM27_3819 [Gemmatimonadetes bacterium]|nr:hypothetical protein [Gemmatimonadota bacterium]